jgi:hypothetical protein
MVLAHKMNFRRGDNFPDTGGYRNVENFITMVYLIATPIQILVEA